MSAFTIERGLSNLGIKDLNPIIRGAIKEYGINFFSAEVERFDPEALKFLDFTRFSVRTLTGRTPEGIVNMDRGGIGVSTDLDMGSFMAIPSRLSQVAFATRPFFLPGTNNLTFDRQMEHVQKLNDLWKENFPEIRVKAVLGSISDWIEVFWQNILTTGLPISREDSYGYTVASDAVSASEVLDIGGLVKSCGYWSVDVNPHLKEVPLRNVFVAPMLVPDSS